MTEPDTEVFLPIREASRLLGVSLDTVRRWEAEGRIESTRSGGNQRMFTLEQIERARRDGAA